MERAQALSSTVDLPPDPSADDPRAWYLSLDVAFDAVPLWRRIRSPVLAVFGEHDASTPTSVVVPRLRAALGSGENEIVVLPDVGDTMLLEERGHRLRHIRGGTFAPAFLALMDNWIRRWLAPQRARDAP